MLPLAFYNPESTFTGIDNANSELNRAIEGVKSLELKNIDFKLKDVRDLKPTDFPPCDYIIAHGLYSWVPEEARDTILQFCQGTLAPDGLSYISYNAQPGWATRHLVRETLLRNRSVQGAAIEDKAEKAKTVAEQLLEDLPSRDYAHAVLLAGELERVRDAKQGYVFHEYLAEVNEGFWLRDFVEKARGFGLDYVCDAQFCRWEGHVPAELRDALAQRNLDPIEQEEAADLLCHRSFHASILCRADAPRTSTTHKEILETIHIATSLSAESDPFDLMEGVVERFSGTNGMKVTLDASITKAAIVSLAREWPKGKPLKQLHEQAVNVLKSNGFEVNPDARSQLSDNLITLFEAGQVDFRLKEPEYSMKVPKYPRAHALARYEAEHRETLTTPHHFSLPFEADALAMVFELDGSRSLDALGNIFGNKLVEDTILILARWGLLEEN